MDDIPVAWRSTVPKWTEYPQQCGIDNANSLQPHRPTPFRLYIPTRAKNLFLVIRNEGILKQSGYEVTCAGELVNAVHCEDNE